MACHLDGTKPLTEPMLEYCCPFRLRLSVLKHSSHGVIFRTYYLLHDDVMTRTHSLRYRSFHRWIQWSPVDSPYNWPVVQSLGVLFVIIMLTKQLSCPCFETSWRSCDATAMARHRPTSVKYIRHTHVAKIYGRKLSTLNLAIESSAVLCDFILTWSSLYSVSVIMSKWRKMKERCCLLVHI